MSDHSIRVLQIADDLASLPLPAEALWVRSPRPHRQWGRWLAVTVGVAILLIVVTLPLIDRVALELERGTGASVTASPVPAAASGSSPVTPAATAPLAVPPFCTHAAPLLDIDHPPPPGSVPGTGAVSAEDAFRRAFPGITQWTMYPFSEKDPIAVWIIADGQSYIAMILGDTHGNNWFAYRARFVRCVPYEDLRN